MSEKLRLGRYDFAAFLTFGTYAMVALSTPLCLVPIALDLGFPLDEGGMSRGGALQIARSVSMVAAMILCGFIAAKWGKRRSLGFSLLFMAAGIFVCSISPFYAILFVGMLVSGLGEGVIEGLVTPFVQDLHPEQPGRYLNLSHAFWSVGTIVMVLGGGALLQLGVSWRIVLALAGVAALIPAVMYLIRPPAGHRETGEKTHWRDVCRNAGELLRQRRFWLFFAAMFFAGGGEFCLTFWCASFIRLEFGGSAVAAGVGTACFAFGMFLGRFGSGILVHQHNLKKLIVVLAAAATLFCLPFPWLASRWLLFPLLFFAGVAVGPFWPSIQSDGTHRLTGDHTMAMILFSCAGIPGSGFFTTLIGVLGDMVGLRFSFLVVPACFMMVLLLMGYDMLKEKAEGQ